MEISLSLPPKFAFGLYKFRFFSPISTSVSAIKFLMYIAYDKNHFPVNDDDEIKSRSRFCVGSKFVKWSILPLTLITATSGEEQIEFATKAGYE
ncbi:hypothetical protein A4A49_29973 [Nicotiana attenuata]|uniref:Uncharacterized protein n=1 Tax=Nicotiana attenuata TaxID=49451 RepID=A0A1J6KCM7_NICAT|nr:hypothetical protein A4A49_29973 [Nicotiana attenuata]